MKRVLVFLLLLVAAPAAAEPVRLFDNVLSFDLPSAFRPMTAVEIGKNTRLNSRRSTATPTATRSA
jgi:hypothetical protein